MIVAYYWYPHGGSAQYLPLAPTAFHIRTSEPPRRFEPFHRLEHGFHSPDEGQESLQYIADFCFNVEI